jgi:hypothetical protein
MLKLPAMDLAWHGLVRGGSPCAGREWALLGSRVHLARVGSIRETRRNRREALIDETRN